jgi:hypothetical protein
MVDKCLPLSKFCPITTTFRASTYNAIHCMIRLFEWEAIWRYILNQIILILTNCITNHRRPL